MPLNHLLPSSLKARPHLGPGEGLPCCCINQQEGGAAWGTRAKFGAEHPMMWFRVFISTNARIRCPTKLFLLNEDFFLSKPLQNQQPSITRKDKVNFSLPSPQPINSSVVWCHPHFCAIFNLNFCVLVFEAARARLLNPCCSTSCMRLSKQLFSEFSKQIAKWRPTSLLGRYGGQMPASGQRRAEESEQWERACEKPAPPSHALAKCSSGGLKEGAKFWVTHYPSASLMRGLTTEKKPQCFYEAPLIGLLPP